MRPETYAGLQTDIVPQVARGCGRAYGDAALNERGVVVLTERLDRLLAFDGERGLLRAEAGMTLADVLSFVVPRGWFPAVTPGTRFVTLGGCVAADVHGKNHHHDGSFGAHVTALELITAEARRLRCSPRRQVQAFGATVGGMGLTGIVGEVAVQLRAIETAYMMAEHRVTSDLDGTLALLDAAEFDDQYTVAWVDDLATGTALGRGVFMRAHHATRDELPARLQGAPLLLAGRHSYRIPVDLPAWFLARPAVRAFNALYYRRQRARRAPFVVDYPRFFYPLDAIGDWNRLYGRRGLIQYQCVVPLAQARAGLRLILTRLARAGCGSFLSVLKRLGDAGAGLLSFPMAGYTLALDIPWRGDRTRALLAELDELVIDHGGRVYLAKDACLSPASFRAMYPRFAEWWRIKQRLDPEGRFSSSLSRRLQIEEGP